MKTRKRKRIFNPGHGMGNTEFKAIRERLNWSGDRFAKQIGYSQGSVSRYERLDVPHWVWRAVFEQRSELLSQAAKRVERVRSLLHGVQNPSISFDGIELTELRRALGMSQSSLGNYLGYGNQRICMFENRETPPPADVTARLHDGSFELLAHVIEDAHRLADLLRRLEGPHSED